MMQLEEELRTRAPRNAYELNIWLRQHFQVFEAPGRAYFDFVIDETRVERRTHVMATWTGAEYECVNRARECFTIIYKNPDEFADASMVLFIRRWAEYQQPHYDKDENWSMVPGRLTIRFSLWDLDTMNRIGTIFPIRPEGHG